jgi:hypothetical protein
MGRGWRSVTAPSEWDGRLPPPTGTVNLQAWIDTSPWRRTAGWTFAAALLASGVLGDWRILDPLRLVLLWLLVDLIWGAMWKLAGGRRSLLALRARAPEARLNLPYMQPASPADQLISQDDSNAIPYLMRIALPLAVIALLVSSVLGMSAVGATAVMAAVTVAGWTLRRALQTPPLLLHALAILLLPWLLVVWQMGLSPSTSAWTVVLLLGLFWTVHAWGEARLVPWPQDRLALILMSLAELAILVLLIAQKSLVWIPIVALLLLPTWLKVMRRESPAGLSIWWALATLASAAAIANS